MEIERGSVTRHVGQHYRYRMPAALADLDITNRSGKTKLKTLCMKGTLDFSWAEKYASARRVEIIVFS